MLKLSIITINLNNAKGLQETIESVVYQTFTDFEYIVIDGGSNDGSVDIIKQYSDKITYWVSEPDTGIYNAMNKGILQSRAEYCLFNPFDIKDIALKIKEVWINENFRYMLKSKLKIAENKINCNNPLPVLQNIYLSLTKSN